MKKYIYTLILLICIFGIAFADSKISDLDEITDIQSTDNMYVLDYSGGTYSSKRISVLNVFDMIDTLAELETISNGGAYMSDILAATTKAGAATIIGVGTGDSPQFTGIELSHATENTLTASSGVLSIEGVQVYMVGDEATILDVADSVTDGSNYINFGDEDDDTTDELFEAIDDSWGSISENTVEGYIFDDDNESVLGIWTNADNVFRNFGTDNDFQIGFATAGDRLEIRYSDDSVGFWFTKSGEFGVAAGASPGSIFDDSDCPGTDKEIARVEANFLSGADGAEDGSIWLESMLGGTERIVWHWDSDTEAVTEGDSATGEDIIRDYDTGTANQVTYSSNSGVTELNFSAFNLVTTGNIMGGQNVSIKAGAYTVGTDDPDEVRGTMFVNSNVADLTLAGTVAVVGASGCLMQGAGITGIMQLEPGTGSHLVYQGVEMSDGTPLASAGAATDRICWVGISSDHWLITSSTGTWAE